MEEIKVNRPVKEVNNVTSTSGQYNKVVVKQLERDSTEEIHPEVLYLTIPSEWTCTYHQLINYVADAGKAIIDDCSFACKGDGKKLFNCWGLFQSACAAYQQSDYTKANFYYNYVKQQLENYYDDLLISANLTYLDCSSRNMVLLDNIKNHFRLTEVANS